MSRYSVKELRAIFKNMRKKNLTFDDTAKDLHIRSSALRYWYKRIYGKYYRHFRRLEPRYQPPSDQTTVAYIAGILDGEGWISHQGRGAQIGIANTHKGLIRFLCGFGGLYHERKTKTYGRIKSAKTQWSWHITRALDVLVFLRMVYPYLRVKKQRAKKFIKFLSKRLGQI